MANSAATPSEDSVTNPVWAAALSKAAERGVPPRGGQELPLVDAAVLQDLAEELGQPDMAWNFANDYAAMWEPRQRFLRDSLGREDRAAALDAVISLKVSSAMVGGLRLAGLAEALESNLRKGDLRDGASVMAMISLQGHATVKELRLRYIRKTR